jgi:hypothetical protein
MKTMNNTGWKNARARFEDRQALLGQHGNRITTDYSAPELNTLIAAAKKVCDEDSHGAGENFGRNSGRR